MPLRIGDSRAALVALLVLAAVSLAGGATAWLRSRGADERVAALARELAAARDDASTVAAKHAALLEYVARLEAALAAANAAATAVRSDVAAPESAASGAPTPEQAPVAANEPDSGEPDLSAAQPHGAFSAFDSERLLAAGFRREDVERFRARLDDIELRRLYLRDQATRENWLESPRYAEESQTLFRELTGLREEFDEPLYDWVLYSTGHPNRVAVREVISGSAAESAGLLRGDVIVRYDDRLVLSLAELRDATTQGRAGELVAIEVRRQGDPAPRRIFVPRGPIGISLAPTAMQPAPAG